MIHQLGSPSVCVIDDESKDYQHILDALNGLFVSSVHLSGEIAKLPPKPFDRMRLIFVDLHLSGTVGKDAASYTANFFTKVVSPATAPVVVVIWSKYSDNKVPAEGVPPEDQETEAGLFKRTLLEAEPKYEGRLIFLELSKPMPDDRPGDWSERLKDQIAKALKGQSAIDVLWAWDSLVKDASGKVGEELTSIAQTAVAGTGRSLHDGLKATMQQLAKAQGEGDLSAATAGAHLASVLTQLLIDHLEHMEDPGELDPHGTWLSEDAGPVNDAFRGHMNSHLLTAGAPDKSGLYVPGTIYQVMDAAGFKSGLGVELSQLVTVCCQPNLSQDKIQAWNAGVRPVLIELSPVCDVAQNKRVSASLVAGLLVPATIIKSAKRDGQFHAVGPFKLRWPLPDFAEQNVTLVFCHTYRITLSHLSIPAWIKPWFRLRELPTTAIRNANAANAARVGFVAM